MARRTGRAKPMPRGEAVLPMSQSISRMPYGDI